MLKKILSYGTIAGLIVGVPLSALVLTMADAPPPAWGMAVGYLMMLVALSTVFVAVKRHRDVALGGVIRFWPALGLGLGISAVASLVYLAAWEASTAVSGVDFARSFTDGLIAEQRAKGVSGEALAKFVAEMESFKVQYANPLYRLPIIFLEIFWVGVVVSLVCAGLLRNPRFLPARG